MANRLGSAISPYLRSHADNPVDWFSWGEEAFAEAVRRDVPVLVSIGYSTCHWCHVMARESFSDPQLAAQLNAGFVAIKVDREEHPEVDATYLAAAGAFTQNLGWPLNVFVTPEAKPFFAGTYSPPVAVQGNPSFSQVLAAVSDAWVNRRDDLEASAGQLADALVAAPPAASTAEPGSAGSDREPGSAGSDMGSGSAGSDRESGSARAYRLPSVDQLRQVVAELEASEDPVNGGFGGAPKFPVAPVLNFLLAADAPLAVRTLKAMAASDLRDPVEGGFFRYATRADWSEPHYERMLYDNALLLDAYTSAAEQNPNESWAAETAAGIADYLIDVLQIDHGGFASAQDSESVVGGRQSEGGYYALDAEGRAAEVPPKRDEKVLTGWNGLAISALTHAANAFGDPRWLAAAREAADFLLEHHLNHDGTLLRASLGARVSDARATLEDYGMFAQALRRLGAATGDTGYRRIGRGLVDSVLVAAEEAAEEEGSTALSIVFAVPGGGDPVLASRGLLLDADVAEGAYPSGISVLSAVALEISASISELAISEPATSEPATSEPATSEPATKKERYLEAAQRALEPLSVLALARPIGFGASLEVMYALAKG
ncbi:MAG: thioredoxin protein [Subtercola sp.]|nr:thioredoxin protein [Subtercola sp.]